MPLQRALAHQGQRQFALPDGAHAVVHPSRAEPRLRHRKARARLAQQVVRGHPHVPKHDFAVTFWCVVLHDRDVALQRHARCVQWHQQHAMAGVFGDLVVAAAAHHNQESAIRMRRAGNKPFAPVEHPLVAIPVDARLQIGRVA